MIEFRVLGRAELRDGDRGQLDSILAQPKRLAILTYLCLAGRGGFVRRDELIALFWPDSDTERARAALAQSLYVLRRALGPDVVPGRGVEEVGVDSHRLGCDAARFLARLDEGDLAGALDLYDGDLLPALYLDSPEADRWLDDERVSFRNRALNAAEQLGTQAASLGEVDLACDWYRRALQIAPESESAARGLMENLWRGGHRTAALETFERFAAYLRSEYDVEPGTEFRHLVGQIRQDSGLPQHEAPLGGPAPGGFLLTALPAPSNTAPEESRRTRSWPQALAPFALGIATIAALAFWFGGATGEKEGAWYHANQEYLKAWAAWDAGRIDSASAHVQRAVELDSMHARAWALAGYTGALLNAFDQGQPDDLLAKAYWAARKAVQIDDTVAAAWVARAVTRWTYRREWVGAEQDYKHALDLSPDPRWEAIARVDLSALLENLGRCEEAREVLEPYSNLEPPDRILGSGVVVRLSYMCRDYRAAIAEGERAIAAGDTTRSLRQRLFLARLEDGDLAGAEGELHTMQELYPEDALVWFDEALFAARSGRTGEARAIIAQLSQASLEGVYRGQTGVLRAEALAQLHAAVGDLDEAFAVLETAFDQKGHARRLMSHPLFAPLWDDPRYDAMLARMTLHCRRDGDLHRCQPLQ